MNILHINASDTDGGAARAAYRLHKGLREVGCDSSMFVAHRHANDSTVTAFKPPMNFISRVYRLVRRQKITRGIAYYRKSGPPVYDLFSDDRSEYGSSVMRQLPPCDVINLHWIASFIDYRHFFPAVPSRIPLVWTLHDMNGFTGGCHYDRGCGKYKNQCCSCPQLGSHSSSDLSHEIWNRKRDIYTSMESGKLHLVALNKWMAEEVKQSSLLRDFPITIIPNGLDTDVFVPRDRLLARDALEIPRDANGILFLADFLTNRRKGFDLLIQALEGLNEVSNLFLISLGKGMPTLDVSVPHLNLGHIENDRLLSLVYSAADVFVIPSQQDNLPNTILESFACGTPVVGFDVGGLPDIVRPGLTGLLARPYDKMALRTSITQLLKDKKTLKDMAANCRRIAVEEYSQEIQANRYIELYNQVLEKHNNSSAMIP